MSGEGLHAYARSFSVNQTAKKEAKNKRKQGQGANEEYKSTAWGFGNKTRKAKASLEVKLARDLKD